MVVVVDTNVISELIRSEPEPAVLGWFDRLSGDEPRITATTVFELYFGAGRLPEGARKAQLVNRIDIVVHEIFRGESSRTTRSPPKSVAVSWPASNGAVV